MGTGLPLAGLTCLLLVARVTEGQEPLKVREVRLGRRPSPDVVLQDFPWARHVAWREGQVGAMRVVVDGTPHDSYEEILSIVYISDDGRRHAYLARAGGGGVRRARRSGPGPIREGRTARAPFQP